MQEKTYNKKKTPLEFSPYFKKPNYPTEISPLEFSPLNKMK
jgi:hypothetical protein